MQQEYADTGKKQQTTAIHSINVFHQQISELNKRNRTILDNPNLDGNQKAALMEQNNTTINNIAKKANKMFPPQ
jgi:L-cysteine desulfidase